MPENPAGHDRIAVIGGGLSGLAAARRVLRARTPRRPLEVALFEAKNRLGGSIWTQRHDGFTLEAGADAFITNKPWGVELCHELGLADRLIETDAKHRRSFVLNRRRLVPVPEGFVMVAPSRLLPIMTTPILSWRGKIRLLMDLVLPKRGGRAEESLASFVRRRLGVEALERLVQPLVGGIYTADPNELSLQATLPQFARMEQEQGSLIRGARHQARRDRRLLRESSGARYGLFASLDEGMDVLIDALANSLPSGVVQTSQAVRRIVRNEVKSGWRVELLDGSIAEADAVVLATEAHAAARLLETHDSELALQLRSIPYASSLVVNIAYPRNAIAHPLDGFGVVIPAVENQQALAISFTSIKFPRRAPVGTALFRVFLGGALQPGLCELADDQIEAIVVNTMHELLGTRGAPLFVQISRHPRAMPQYTLGHLDRVEGIRRLVAHYPGLFLAGNAFDGVGIPDCIRGAHETADAVASYLMARGRAAA